MYNKATDEDHSKRRNTQAAQSKNRGHSVLDPEHEQLQNTPYTTDNIQHATHNTENTQYSQKSQYPIRNQQLLIQYSNPTRIAYLGNTIKRASYASMNFHRNIKKYQENIFKIIKMTTRKVAKLMAILIAVVMMLMMILVATLVMMMLLTMCTVMMEKSMIQSAASPKGILPSIYLAADDWGAREPDDHLDGDLDDDLVGDLDHDLDHDLGGGRDGDLDGESLQFSLFSGLEESNIDDESLGGNGKF